MMRKIGLLGGVSWQSTLLYYHWINEEVQRRLGGYHSARMLVESLDFQDVISIRNEQERGKVLRILQKGYRSLVAGGADFVLLCSNTLHCLADELEQSMEIPLLHIADVVAEEAQMRSMLSLGLLGTRFTMQQDFYVNRLRRWGLQVLTPSRPVQQEVHRILFEEAVRGHFAPSSKQFFRSQIQAMFHTGCDGVILGCTEIPLLVSQSEMEVPLLDSARLHVMTAVDLSLLEEQKQRKSETN